MAKYHYPNKNESLVVTAMPMPMSMLEKSKKYPGLRVVVTAQ